MSTERSVGKGIQEIEIRPQPGPQTAFLASGADIAIYGGAAGGGKTWALIIEPLRHFKNSAFGAVIFRRTYPEITREGGMWDESMEVYPLFGARPNLNELHWTFPNGARISFAHLQHEADKLDYKGAQIALEEFDQLETFSESQFFYLLSRNRSISGVRPYVRATCNPDPEAWLASFLAWWIDPETGFAIPERAGRLRWTVRAGDEIVWADRRGDLAGRFPDLLPKSVTFVPASVFDNKILLARDPQYLGNLMMLPPVERDRLLRGNWKVRPAAGRVFKREWFAVDEDYPRDARSVRYWDLAATEPSKEAKAPNWTAGALVCEKDGIYTMRDVRRDRLTPHGVEQLIRQTALLDGVGVTIYIEQEPGSAGKNTIDHYQREVLKGFAIVGDRVTGSKLERANPLSAAAQAGNVHLLKGDWNDAFLIEAEQFPDGAFDDQVDAASGALEKLAFGAGTPAKQSESYNRALRDRIQRLGGMR